MTFLELRDALAELLGDLLGTFSDGIPAIWVEPPAAPIGNAVGLACIIGRYKAMKRSESLSSNQLYQNYDWVVTLVQFDTSKQGCKKLALALDILQRAFPNHRERTLPFSEDSYPQITFLIEEHAILNQRG